MPNPPGKAMMGCYVDADLAARFRAWARPRGGVSAVLRRFIAESADGAAPPPPPGAVAREVRVRLRERERLALAAAAEAKGMPVAAYLRALAVVHLSRVPQWGTAEAEALRQVGEELRRVGNNANQIARALHVAVSKGEYPAGQGEAAREAAEMVRAELRRVVAIYTGNLAQWGDPLDEVPQPARGALAEADRAEKTGRARVRLRSPSQRPRRFRA